MLLMGFFLTLLVILSGIAFVLAYLVRSWKGMLLGGLATLPLAWFIAMYPPYPWALYLPLVHLVFAGFFFYKKQKVDLVH